jgi:stage V sporulation protein K
VTDIAARNRRGPNLRLIQEKGPVDFSQVPGVNLGKESVLEELNSLVGLTKVKELIFEIYAFAEVQKRRERLGLSTQKTVLHMIFKGNPGTGKTTIARIIGKLLHEAGLLEKGHVVEVERADLVGEYIGHTAQKTKEQIRKAQGGILFIDEAYSLCRGGDKDFGKECIDCIVKGMEDHAKETVFILAGYPTEMEYFVRSNPGLRSRFPIHLDFPDYSLQELMKIADLMLKQRDYRLSMESRTTLQEIISRQMRTESVPSNARMVRNIIERSMRRQAVRLIRANSFTRQDLIMIAPEELLEASYDDI